MDDGSTALFGACSYDKIKCLKELVNAKADINACNILDVSPLFQSILEENYECAEYLLKQPNINVELTELPSTYI
jgi:ankyrin repeat protein